MGKILLFASFAVTLLTAVLGFVNKNNAAAAKEQAATAEAQVTTVKNELASKEKAIKDANTALTAANAEKEQVAAQVAAAQTEATNAKSELSEATAKVTAAEDKAKTAEASLASVQQELETAKSGAANAAPPGPSPEQTAMIEELKTVNQQLTQKNDALSAQVEEAQKKDADRTALKMRDGVEGRVLAVNPAWNFVVLNLGDKQGVVNNAELLVKRGRQLVGKVRITSVEPSTSIADIVANSVPSGTVISPGDNVIFQAVEE